MEIRLKTLSTIIQIYQSLQTADLTQIFLISRKSETRPVRAVLSKRA
jgi:hypothetical protein